MRFIYSAAWCLSIWVLWGPAWGQTEDKASQVKQPPAKETASSQNEQRGTKDAPFFIHIEQGNEESKNAAPAGNGNANNEDWNKASAEAAIWTAVFTGLLVGVGIIAACYANRTLKAIELQAKMMAREIALSHRAYLKLRPLDKPRGREIRFELENSGHVPTIIMAVTVEIIGPDRSSKTIGNWEEGTAPIERLAPGQPFCIILTIPDGVDATDFLMIGRADYGIGFRDDESGGIDPSDTFRFAQHFSGKNMAWDEATTYAEIDMKSASPT